MTEKPLYTEYAGWFFKDLDGNLLFPCLKPSANFYHTWNTQIHPSPKQSKILTCVQGSVYLCSILLLLVLPCLPCSSLSSTCPNSAWNCLSQTSSLANAIFTILEKSLIIQDIEYAHMEKLIWNNMLGKNHSELDCSGCYCEKLEVFETRNVNSRAIFCKYLEVMFGPV